MATFPITEQNGAPLRQIVRGGPTAISIFVACKTTLTEALLVLYERNTISLCHHEYLRPRQSLWIRQLRCQVDVPGCGCRLGRTWTLDIV